MICRDSHHRPRLAALAACLMLLIAAPAAHAASHTYKPNKLADHVPNGCKPSDCTLREAVIAANGHPGRDTVVLRGRKTYVLSVVAGVSEESLGDLDVTDPVTITSSSKRLATVDANGIDRAFQVSAATTFEGLRVRGGDAAFGGGINADPGGSIKLLKSTITGNHADFGAGGINGAMNATLKISQSVISANSSDADGGGVYAAGETTISKSTIAGNFADADDDLSGNGGGIITISGLTLKVNDSTISGNRGINGGGIHNVAGTVNLVNDTITKNSAGSYGGGTSAVGGATYNLNAVTVARNDADAGGGGGLSGDSGNTYNLRNSLIALNTAVSGFGPDCLFGSAQTSGGNNLIGNAANCTGFPDSSDHVVADPKIGQLAANGGPTKTIALKASSAAVNQAGSDAPKRDQRGVTRGNDPDIGAFERG